jgi:hypothetical protein
VVILAFIIGLSIRGPSESPTIRTLSGKRDFDEQGVMRPNELVELVAHNGAAHSEELRLAAAYSAAYSNVDG